LWHRDRIDAEVTMLQSCSGSSPCSPTRRRKASTSRRLVPPWKGRHQLRSLWPPAATCSADDRAGETGSSPVVGRVVERAARGTTRPATAGHLALHYTAGRRQSRARHRAVPEVEDG
jgi:hypothetical protein